MSRYFSDVATGWSFDCLTDASGIRPPAGGLVLQNVQHQLNNFARDIRLIGLRLKIQLINPPNVVVNTTSHFLILSDPPFTIDPIQILQPSAPVSPTISGSVRQYLRETDEALQFRTYFQDSAGNYIAYGIKADYVLPSTYIATHFPNCEISDLRISQRFLFSRYGVSPPHEPGGVLYAARCHPLIKYEFTPNQSVNRASPFYRIDSIRFDYRLHLLIDRHHEVSANSSLPQIGNQAGLFKDQEVAIGLSAPLAPFSGSATSRTAFGAVEKPLVAEVVAPGLNEGLTILGTRSIYPPSSSLARTWDNVHWWGARGLGNPIISTPGGFHAAHIHWRWGGAGSFAGRFLPGARGFIHAWIPEIDTSGVPTAVQSHPWAGASTRTLVDPRIWIQSLRVAVIKNERNLDPNQPNVQLQNLSCEDWQTLFTGLRAAPIDIYNGDDIVFWYSTEVHRSTRLPAVYHHAIFPTQIQPATTYYSEYSGTVFLHGIFFGHNAERTGFGVGGTGPQHWPNDINTIRRSRQWFRTA